MTPRDRVLAAASHREPDTVPLFYRDVPDVERRLLKDLGLASREELLRHLEIDFRWIGARYTGPDLGDPASGRKRDIWGVEYRHVPTETGGNWEAVDCPLRRVTDVAALADYPWPRIEWFDFAGLAEQTRRHKDYALMTAPGVDSPGVMLAVMDLLGMERTMTDMALNPDFIQGVVDRIVQFNLEYFERFFAVVKDRLDFFRMGDDFGTQRGLLISPAMYRRFFQPALRRMAEPAKAHGARYYHHSCGAIRRLIPDLIDTGVDVLDPLQVKADGMDPAELKAEFGDRLCFSGGVDEQELLPRGTPEEVRRAVHDLLDMMMPGGGFFLGPTHNFQTDIPTDNIVAMYAAAREWRRA